MDEPVQPVDDSAPKKKTVPWAGKKREPYRRNPGRESYWRDTFKASLEAARSLSPQQKIMAIAEAELDAMIAMLPTAYAAIRKNLTRANTDPGKFGSSLAFISKSIDRILKVKGQDPGEGKEKPAFPVGMLPVLRKGVRPPPPESFPSDEEILEGVATVIEIPMEPPPDAEPPAAASA